MEPISDLHIHEVLDRSATLELMLHELLEEHPALVLGNLSALFEHAAKALHALYQEAGRVSVTQNE